MWALHKSATKSFRVFGTLIRTRSSTSEIPTSSKWDKLSAPDKKLREDQVPKQSDVIIVGGGVIGWAVAFWLRWHSKYSVTLIEKDPSYVRSATVLGLGSIRQQFSEPENIQMSLFGFEFMRNIKDYLSVLDDVQLDIGFNPQGCLVLANQHQVQTLQDNYQIQMDLGAKVQLMTKNDLTKRWPWMNVEDVELGCFGYENEGWFDPWLLLRALRAKSHFLGVNYVVGEVIDFEASPHTTTISFPDMPRRPSVTGRALRSAIIALPDGSTTSITFNTVVNAAGPWAADIAKLAEIGTEHLPLSLPVEPRIRNLFVVKPNQKMQASSISDSLGTKFPGLDTPFIIDPNRLFIERRGLSGEFIVYSDNLQSDQQCDKVSNEELKLDVDYEFFKRHINPLLSNRIPGLKDADISSAWAAICDYNTFDQNLIIGHHPFHVNMLFCNGSSGHGTQHSIAIGRAISELILFGHFKTIDLTRFSFDRLYFTEKIKETNAF